MEKVEVKFLVEEAGFEVGQKVMVREKLAKELVLHGKAEITTKKTEAKKTDKK
jgi:hypothetical protein